MQIMGMEQEQQEWNTNERNGTQTPGMEHKQQQWNKIEWEH